MTTKRWIAVVVVLATLALDAVISPSASTGAPPPAAVSKRDAMIQGAQEFRRANGMRSDEEYTASLNDRQQAPDGSPVRFVVGYPMTQSEAAEFDARDRMRASAKTAAVAYALAQPEFDGFTLDAAGGVVVAQFAGDANRHLKALTPYFEPGRVQVASVPYSHAQLEGWQTKVADALNVAGIQVSYTNLEAKRAVFGVTSRDQEARTIAARYAPADAVVVNQTAIGTATGVAGGGSVLAIGGNFQSTAGCTQAFSAWNSSGYRGRLTAGHCWAPQWRGYRNWSTAFMAGQYFPAVSVWTNSATDSALFDQTADLQSASNGFTTVNDILQYWWELGTYTTCFWGSTTASANGGIGQRCGRISGFGTWMTATNWGASDVINVQVYFLEGMGYLASPGDSGGPAYTTTGKGAGQVEGNPNGYQVALTKLTNNLHQNGVCLYNTQICP